MKKKKKYLKLYKKWSKTGEVPSDGLCNVFSEGRPFDFKTMKWDFTDNPLFELFEPNRRLLRSAFWAYNGEVTKDGDVVYEKLAYEFTPLRQTIVLFMAALNGEL